MQGRSWNKIMLIVIVCILSVPLLKEAVAQEGRTLEERLATLEAKVTELERRLSRLEGPVAREEPKRVRVSKSPISLTLLSKSFIKADPMAGNANDRIDFIFDLTSHLPKDIGAFKGVLVLKDNYDQKLLESELIVEDTIKAGVLLGWRGSISMDYDSSLDTHRMLLAIDKNNLRTKLVLKEVTYTDGTREAFSIGE